MLRPSDRLSVSLSDGCIIENRLKIGLENFHLSSPIPLVFVGRISSRNSKGFPQWGASNKGGVGKISSFLSLSVNISKTVADTANVTIHD